MLAGSHAERIETDVPDSNTVDLACSDPIPVDKGVKGRRDVMPVNKSQDPDRVPADQTEKISATSDIGLTCKPVR